MIRKPLGGERIGSGNKNTVEPEGYQRSTHDLSQTFRTTQSPGTVIPFFSEVSLPGDTWDIQLSYDGNTHPTNGPLFGKFRVELYIFEARVSLYQAQLHNNKTKIGMNMGAIKLPIMKLFADPALPIDGAPNPNTAQINPSSLIAYLDVMGVGTPDGDLQPDLQERDFYGVPLLMYWDCIKNFYVNKQEEKGYYIFSPNNALVNTVDDILLAATPIATFPTVTPIAINNAIQITINYTGTSPRLEQILINTTNGQYSLLALATNILDNGLGVITANWNISRTGATTVNNWNYIAENQLPVNAPTLWDYDISMLDDMREEILAAILTPTPFDIGDIADTKNLQPYKHILKWENGRSPYMGTQQGLAVKTYKSDLFNNWLNTEWLDGISGINKITKIDTSSGGFEINTLLINTKIFDQLNKVAVSGGSYDDWQEANWMVERYKNPETPVFHGGLIKEIIFQEVVSNSQAGGGGTTTPEQPLGTLAGKGTIGSMHKGGNITIKTNEISHIMGLMSITPIIDYSQGNKWHMYALKTMDDFHPPMLDQIGFQELIQEQMAYWTTLQGPASPSWTQKSAGKQPAWTNYMTNVNKLRGNFAAGGTEDWMVLNRRYDYTITGIQDLTTYIDPVKYNYIFADTSIDAQNFWSNVHIKATVRRKMSAKIMPKL